MGRASQVVEIGGKMKAPGGKFGRKQEEAIAALLTQRNIEEAAKAAGIGANPLLRWLQVPEFQAAYRQARRAAFGQAVARLQQGTSAAATTLLKTLVDAGTPASVKVRAAEAIFSHAAKAIEIEDISEEQARGLLLKARVPVISLFGPIVRWTLIRVRDGSNPLYVFDAIFGWDHQPQRCTVLEGKGRSIHFVAQESLRVERTCHVNSHIIFLAWGFQTHIGRVHRIRRKLYAEI